MGNTFADDYAWQMTFQPAVESVTKATFGPDVSVQFTYRESDADRYFNTDAYLSFDGQVHKMAMRLRRYVIGDEFTIRYLRPGASRTEWTKALDGHGDFYLYGRGIDSDRHLDNWFIGRLDVFRDWVFGYLNRGVDPPHQIKHNKDGSASFVVFKRSDLPYEFTVGEDRDAELRDLWWAIVKDSSGMEKTGHAAAVLWARAGLGLDDR